MSKVTANISSKNWWDHFRESLSPPWLLLSSSFVSFATFWTFIEAGDFSRISTPEQVRAGWFYLYLLCFSVFIGAAFNFLRYWNDVLVTFDHLPDKARRIVRRQGKGWEFHLAQILIVDSISPLDNRLKRVLNGEAYIPLKTRCSNDDYFDLMKLRLSNTQAMILTIEQWVQKSFPQCFSGTLSVGDRCKRIEQSVSEFEEFYRSTVEDEEELKSVAPPDGFERVHKIQEDWTECARLALRELLEALQVMRDAAVGPETTEKASFTVHLSAPSGLNEFQEELKNLPDSVILNES
ncbi:MAG: hypothetical protein AAF558_09885 [Verrucomicrobiota bacterium]